MRYLYKVVTTTIEGSEGMESLSQCFISSDLEKIENEKPITEKDVRDADVAFLSYMSYENLGPLSLEELEVLRKFKIIG
jgi:hypothetical protein